MNSLIPRYLTCDACFAADHKFARGLSCVKDHKMKHLFFSLGIKEHTEYYVIKHVGLDNTFAKVLLF